MKCPHKLLDMLLFEDWGDVVVQLHYPCPEEMVLTIPAINGIHDVSVCVGVACRVNSLTIHVQDGIKTMTIENHSSVDMRVAVYSQSGDLPTIVSMVVVHAGQMLRDAKIKY